MKALGLLEETMNTPAWRPLPDFCTSRSTAAPFPSGYVDDYLPEELVADLESSFLDPGRHARLDVLTRGKKRVVFRAPPVPDFVAEAGPAWVEAVRTVSSRQFLEPTWDCIRDILAAEPLPVGPYQDLLAEQLSLGIDDLLVQIEFSSLEADAHLLPHTDAADKLLSCVLYLPQDDWQPEWGGATEVYVPRSASPDKPANPNWSNRLGTPEDVTTVEVVPFVRNRLFWFIKTANSWHGVSMVTAPPGVGRRSFNFSVALKPETLERPRLAGLVRDVTAYENSLWGMSATAPRRRRWSRKPC